VFINFISDEMQVTSKNLDGTRSALLNFKIVLQLFVECFSAIRFAFQRSIIFHLLLNCNWSLNYKFEAQIWKGRTKITFIIVYKLQFGV
jgi:hypothetical protein